MRWVWFDEYSDLTECTRGFIYSLECLVQSVCECVCSSMCVCDCALYKVIDHTNKMTMTPLWCNRFGKINKTTNETRCGAAWRFFFNLTHVASSYKLLLSTATYVKLPEWWFLYVWENETKSREHPIHSRLVIIWPILDFCSNEY